MSNRKTTSLKRPVNKRPATGFKRLTASPVPADKRLTTSPVPADKRRVTGLGRVILENMTCHKKAGYQAYEAGIWVDHCPLQQNRWSAASQAWRRGWQHAWRNHRRRMLYGQRKKGRPM